MLITNLQVSLDVNIAPYLAFGVEVWLGQYRDSWAHVLATSAVDLSAAIFRAVALSK